jgi:hypothetical protein
LHGVLKGGKRVEYHTRITIDVTTSKERFVVRVVEDNRPSDPIFDVTMSRTPYEGIVDALAAMSKVLEFKIRTFMHDAPNAPAAVPVPVPASSIPSLFDLGLVGPAAFAAAAAMRPSKKRKAGKR